MSIFQSLADIEWQHPAAWWLALVPLLLWLLIRLRRRRVLLYAEASLRPWAIRDESTAAPAWGRVAREAMRVLAWMLLAAALAGPRLPRLHSATTERHDASRGDVDLMVVVQVPFRPKDPVARTYLRRVWVELQDLGSRLHGERLGLIAYNGRAGMLATPTSDEAAFRFYLQRAGKVLAGWRGDALGEALARADAGLAEARAAGHSAGIILLAAGGVSPDPTVLGRSLHRLRTAGIPVYALDMSTFVSALLAQHAGSRAFDVPGFRGASSAAAAPSGFTAGATWLREVARETNGIYARLANGDADWHRLYDDGAGELPSDSSGRTGTGGLVRSWHELYAWCLAPGLLLLLIDAGGFEPGGWLARRRMLHSGSLLALLLTVTATGWPIPARAGSVNSARDPGTTKAYASAYGAYAAHDYALAQLRFESMHGYAARLGQGASAYRRGDYRHAARQFGAALLAAGDARQRASALFDLGNARFRLRQYRRAVEAYQGALRYRRGDDERIRTNLWLARSQLGRRTHRRFRTLGRDSGLPARRGESPEGFPDETPPALSAPRPTSRGGVARRIARGQLAAKPDVAGGVGGGEDSDDVASSGDRGVLKLLELVDDHATALLRGVLKHEAPPDGLPDGGGRDISGVGSP